MRKRTSPRFAARRREIRRRIRKQRARGAAGSASEWHSEGHRFDPGRVHSKSGRLAEADRPLLLGRARYDRTLDARGAMPMLGVAALVPRPTVGILVAVLETIRVVGE